MKPVDGWVKTLREHTSRMPARMPDRLISDRPLRFDELRVGTTYWFYPRYVVTRDRFDHLWLFLHDKVGFHHRPDPVHRTGIKVDDDGSVFLNLARTGPDDILLRNEDIASDYLPVSGWADSPGESP